MYSVFCFKIYDEISFKSLIGINQVSKVQY